ncbi:hypothetical protein Metme_3270 [Methylomonas methanica MC09]|uniref:Uncharacterized protein n=1 Tax=Methylomonas methanica (strain DSM 25384 / MC09) TaxID=857087 RepID=G0A5D6_METMM|nr:hypothetical protein Metme_3270 [Methylomonas methanica MC09]
MTVTVKHSTLPGLVLALCLSACTTTQTHPTKPLRVDLPLPDIAAEFETRIERLDSSSDAHEPQRYRWRFYRSAKRIETHLLPDNSGESWTQLPDGDIAYQRLFHTQKQLIDYLPGDLKAIGSQPNWLRLATLINADHLENFVAQSSDTILGRSVTHYTDDTRSNPVELAWLEAEQLPALLRRRGHGHTVTTRLIAVYRLDDAPWERPNSDAYQTTDFADLGDKENNAFIKSILPQLKGTQSHEH